MSGNGSISDAAAMLIWSDLEGWERFIQPDKRGRRKLHNGRWCWVAGEDIGQWMRDYPPHFLASFFRSVEITHRSWLN